MKKFFFLTLTVIAIYTTSHAQIARGTKLLGGSFGTSLSKSENTPRSKSTYYIISPSVGFTIKENTVLGVNASFSHFNDTYQQTRDERDSYYGGVFYRRYLTLGKGFYLFGQGNLGYNLTDHDKYSHQTFNGEKLRAHGVGFSVFPGLTFAAGKRLHLELGINNLVALNYSTGTTKFYSSGFYSEAKQSGVSFTADADPESNLMVGFRFALGK